MRPAGWDRNPKRRKTFSPLFSATRPIPGASRFAGTMEIYPIHHKNLIFNIITDYDLTFTEVRGILDYLLNAGAFGEQARVEETGKFYDVTLEDIQYVVDVNAYEVVVYQRTELGRD